MAACAPAHAEDAVRAAVGGNSAFAAPTGVAPSAEPPRTYAPVHPAGPEEVEQQFKRGQNPAFSRWSGPARPGLPAATQKNDPSSGAVLRVGTGKAAARSGGGTAPGAPGAAGSSLSMAPSQLQKE